MTEPPASPTSPSADAPPVAAPERRDADGLPLDREPTLDDVRGEGSGRSIAVGCTGLIVLVAVAFWILRSFVLR